MPSDRMLKDTITVTVRTHANVGGVAVPTSAASTYRASVQPMRSFRQQQYGLTLGQTGYTVFLTSDPGCGADDVVTWGAKTLAVLAAARDEAGRGRVWAIDCTEQA